MRFVDDDPARDDRAAAVRFLYGAAWFALKWAAQLVPRLAADAHDFADFSDATIAADADAADFVEPRRADAAPAAPAYAAAVMVETDETAGMDDDMKERHRARKAREKATRDGAIARERASIRGRRAPAAAAPPEAAASPRSVAATESDPVEKLAALQSLAPAPSFFYLSTSPGHSGPVARYKQQRESDKRFRDAMRDASGDVQPAVKPPVIPVTRGDDVLLHRGSGSGAEPPRFHAISNDRRDVCVAGNSGCAVRAGPTTDSNKLGELAKGEVVSYTGKQCVCDGRARIEIDKPLKGWISLKLCGPLPKPDAAADDDGLE